ncbi:hypothetical protein CHS0354_032549 [Potamilus streckersoni]|uniref:Uncharacterized protein n=1 Tax=Potamilus streckersoni TaxID=2493646 RepID=A0AAE0VZM5_9BIVA|nr:hypothetical protein CHS0354_032549 [Potamilus streckersoni]
MEERNLNCNQAKHDHDNIHIIPPRTTTVTKTTATITNPSAPQNTKLAPTTPTQTNLNNSGRKLEKEITLPTTSLKLNQSTKSSDNTTTLKSGQKPTRLLPHNTTPSSTHQLQKTTTTYAIYRITSPQHL